MKNVILAFVLFTAFVSHAAENEPVFQPTATSNFLNITGATALAVVKSAVGVGAFTIGLKSVSEICKGEVAGGVLLGGITYVLFGIALKLAANQEGCTKYTSAHLRPLSQGLQTTAGLCSLLASAAIAGYVIREFQQA
ncbi:MAG: hypothetical protein EBU90_23790 [Proteobacteria bacterium]|nr:hypothetical protein [Pseudomonadota bacterium]